MKPGVAARLSAARLLARVMDEGAYSNVVVGQASDVPEDLRPAVHRLTLDTLRWMPKIDPALESISSRPLASVEPLVRSVLRVAAMELDSGGDAHGVIDSSVEVVKEGGLGRAAGFVNAVLRRIARDGFARPDDDGVSSSAAVGAPQWIREQLVATWGEVETDAFLRATLQPAAIGVRWRPGSHPQGTPVDGIPGASFVEQRSDVPTDGAQAVVMDPASTAVALAVGAEPGMRVLDMAAAPGNKTAALWDAMNGVGLLTAADRHKRRVESSQRRLARLGVGAAWVVADGMAPPFSPHSFDRVLIDAPCTGLGTLRRRPEIKLRLDPTAPGALAATQRALVEAALPLVSPGGLIVYAVCTVFAEETIDVVAEFGGRAPADLPGRVWNGGRLLGPHLNGTDGMFISIVQP